MTNIQKWIFNCACAALDGQLFVAAGIDEEAFDDPKFSRWFNKTLGEETNDETVTALWLYSPQFAQLRGDDNPWIMSIVTPWTAVALTMYHSDANQPGRLCILGEEGDVLLSKDGAFVHEKIPGAGVWSDPAGMGYLSGLCQIGDHLYACGYHGQVYKRLGDHDWRELGKHLRQPEDTELDNSIGLSAINGAHENAIYAAGYLHTDYLPGLAFFYDGQQWYDLDLPQESWHIADIYVESESRIWMCGEYGTLLVGNAYDGFQNLSTDSDMQGFTCLCKYKDKMYIASNLALYVYDPQAPERGIEQVTQNLTPEQEEGGIVACFDHMLWSIGRKDITRFDGERWERIHHPENPRIGR